MNSLFLGALALFFAQGLTGRDNRVARTVAVAFVAVCLTALAYSLG
jgi:hypothetical protein